MPPDLALCLTLVSSNYPCLEHLFMVPRCSSHWSSTVLSPMFYTALYAAMSDLLFVDDIDVLAEEELEMENIVKSLDKL